jgi:hypothetical protein
MGDTAVEQRFDFGGISRLGGGEQFLRHGVTPAFFKIGIKRTIVD